MEEDYDEEAYGEEYDEEYDDEDEDEVSVVDYGDDAIKEVHDMKKVKNNVTFLVSWRSYQEKTWETRETVLDYAGAHPLKQFEVAREKQRIENEKKLKREQERRADLKEHQRREEKLRAQLERARLAQEAANVPYVGPGDVVQEIREPDHWAQLRDQLRTEPPPPSYDLAPLAEIAVDTTNEPALSAEQPVKGRVRTLRTLAVNAFSKAVLLYEELGEFPSSLKAPVFALLMKSQELSPDHLKVLLSNDQKKLDFSVSPHIITAEHVLAVTERCRDLEHLDLRLCRNAIGDSGIIAYKGKLMASIAAGCPNLTFLDISYVQLAHNICDITLACRHLRVLRAANCELNSCGLVGSYDLKQPHLEELDVSNNPNLQSLQALSRLFPGNCPNLKILKMSAIGVDESDLYDLFRDQLLSAKNAAEQRSRTSAGASALAKPALRELAMNLAISLRAEPWMANAEFLQDIFSCIKASELESFDFGVQELSLYFSHPKVCNVFRQFLMHAAIWLPGLRTLRMHGVRFSADQLVPESWPRPITLPVTLNHLEWQRTNFPYRMVKRILFPEKFSSHDGDLPVPRLRYLDLSDHENRMSYDPVVLVELMRNTYHPFEKLYLTCIGGSSYETAWDSRFSKDVLSTIGFDEIRLAPQPLLTVLDLSRVRWLSVPMLERLINVNVLPNLRELSIAIGWNLQQEKLGTLLTSSELPPKLTKLTITDKKVDAMILFPQTNIEITAIKHLVIDNSLQYSEGIKGVLRAFTRLERFEFSGRTAVTDAQVWSTIQNDLPTLKEFGFFCAPVPAYRTFFGSLKASNVRTVDISGCVDRGLKEQENKERMHLQMLASRGQITKEEMEDKLYIPGRHRIRVNVFACPCDKTTLLFPSYFV